MLTPWHPRAMQATHTWWASRFDNTLYVLSHITAGRSTAMWLHWEDLKLVPGFLWLYPTDCVPFPFPDFNLNPFAINKLQYNSFSESCKSFYQTIKSESTLRDPQHTINRNFDKLIQWNNVTSLKGMKHIYVYDNILTVDVYNIALKDQLIAKMISMLNF